MPLATCGRFPPQGMRVHSDERVQRRAIALALALLGLAATIFGLGWAMGATHATLEQSRPAAEARL